MFCGSPFTWTEADWPLLCTNEACDMHDPAKRLLVDEPVVPGP